VTADDAVASVPPAPAGASTSGRTLLCVGLATVDLVAHVPGRLEPGVKQFATTLTTAHGGPATTAAVAAARLGARVALVAAVGDDGRGDGLRAAVEAAGVDATLVLRRTGIGTSTSLVVVTPDGERTIVNATDPGLQGALDQAEAAAVIAAARAAGAVLADVRWPAAAAIALAAARDSGIPGVLDLDRAPEGAHGPVRGLVRAASHVVASRDALEDLLTARGAAPTTDVAASLAALQDLADGAFVAVTLGAGGVAWLGPDGTVGHEAAPTVVVVETLGAGDVWHGAFAAGLAAGLTTADAARDANAAAALRCTRSGGWDALPTHAEVVALLAATHPDPEPHP
jgi:sulfofructose kinase